MDGQADSQSSSSPRRFPMALETATELLGTPLARVQESTAALVGPVSGQSHGFSSGAVQSGPRLSNARLRPPHQHDPTRPFDDGFGRPCRLHADLLLELRQNGVAHEGRRHQLDVGRE
jgi:hypothetical protein